MDKIKVLIVDDQTLMRDGLKTILELEDNIEVAAVAKNGNDAIEVCKQNEIDVVLMDIRMPEMDGVQCTAVIKQNFPNLSVLILTTFDDDEYIIDALRLGAAGYILKDIDGDSLIKAVNDVYKGNFILPSNIAMKLAKKLSNTSPDTNNNIKTPQTDLSEREIEIAKMLSQGFTNKQISSALYLSEGTVKNHVSNIYSKIGISDRTSAALYLKELFS